MRATLLRLLGVVALLVSVNGGVVNPVDGIETESDLNTALNLFVNAFKRVMPCGFAPYDMPTLAPYQNPQWEWDYTYDDVHTQGSLSNIVVNGLDNFSIERLSYNPTTKRLIFDFIFPEIQVLFKFGRDTSDIFHGLPYSWQDYGDLNAKIFDYRIAGNNRLEATANGLEITDLDGRTYLGNVVFNNGDNAKNNFVNNFARQYVLMAVQKMQPQILDVQKRLILPTTNEYLQNFNEATLVAFLLEQVTQLDEANCAP